MTSIANFAPRVTLGNEKFEGFWPKESRKIPREEVYFLLVDFSDFPRMLRIRNGGFQPPGQKYNGIKSC